MEVGEEGVRLPPAHLADGAVGGSPEVEGHGSSGAEGMAAQLFWIDTEFGQVDIGGRFSDGFCDGGRCDLLGSSLFCPIR